MTGTITWQLNLCLGATLFTISVLSLTYGLTIDSYTVNINKTTKKICGPFLTYVYVTFNTKFFTVYEDKFRETSEWIMSAFLIGGMIMVPVIGYLGNGFSRRRMLFASSAALFLLLLVNPRFGVLKIQPGFISIFGWQIKLVEYFNFVSILLHACACIIVPVYIGEIAPGDVRGIMGSYFHLFVCIGHVLYTVFGHYLTRYSELLGMVLLVSLAVLNLISLIVLFFLPETPTYYVLNNRTDDAIKALTQLRENDEESALNDFQELLSSVSNEAPNKNQYFSAFKSIVNGKTLKALLIGCVLIAVRQGSCADRMAFLYKEKLQKVHDVNLKMAVDLVVDSLPVVGAIIASILIELCGRKPLLLISSTGMAISIVTQYICNNTPLLFEYQRPLFLQTAYAIYIFSFHLGFGPVPWVLLSEIFKPKAKIPAIALCVFINSMFGVLMNIYAQPRFHDLSEISVLALNCQVGAIFTYFLVPETKGKSVGSILRELECKIKVEEPPRLLLNPQVIVY